MIWGVTPADPLTFAGVILLLLLVAFIATAVPALKNYGWIPRACCGRIRRRRALRYPAGIDYSPWIEGLLFRPLARESAAVLSAAAQEKPVERKSNLKQSACRWCYSKIPIEEFAEECARLGLQVDRSAPARTKWPRPQAVRPDVPTMLGGGTTIPDGLNRNENHAGIEKELPRASSSRGREPGLPADLLLRQPQGHVRRRRPGELRDRPEASHAASPRRRSLRSAWNCSTARSTTRTTCATARRGASSSCKTRRLAALQAALRHLPHADHGRRRDPHDPQEQGLHRPLPHRRQSRPQRDRRTQELNYTAMRKAIVEMGFTGYFAHEFIPKRDPMASLSEAVTLCDV